MGVGGELQDRAEWDENEETPRDQGFQSCLGRWKDRGQAWWRRSKDWGRGQSVWPYRDRDEAPTDESLTGVSSERDVIPNQAKLSTNELEMQSEKIDRINPSMLRRWREDFCGFCWLLLLFFPAFVQIFWNKYDQFCK